jgi:hypothetical protein
MVRHMRPDAKGAPTGRREQVGFGIWCSDNSVVQC